MSDVIDDVFLKLKSISDFTLSVKSRPYKMFAVREGLYSTDKGVLQIRDADFLVQKHKTF